MYFVCLMICDLCSSGGSADFFTLLLVVSLNVDVYRPTGQMLYNFINLY